METTKVPLIEKTFSNYNEVEQWVAAAKPTSHPRSIRLIVDEGALDPSWEFIKNIDEIAVDMGPEDLSLQHDHYLHGTPKHNV